MSSWGFKGHLKSIRLNAPRFLKEHERRATQLVREAAKAWVEEAYPRVPVYTGMARGVFKYAKGRSGTSAGSFLGQYLKVAIPIGPTRTFDGKPLKIREDKSPQIGGEQSRFTFSNSKGVYRFTFGTDVRYFKSNDSEAGQPPSYTRPWSSFASANQAFNGHILIYANSTIPKLKDYLIETDYS